MSTILTEGVLIDGILQQPLWLQIWIGWMMLVNTAAIAFVAHREARIALGAWIGNGITMMALAEMAGFTRILGLSHVLWWTPLVIYLWLQRDRFDAKGAFTKWIYILLVTNVVSLLVDYIDVLRFILGERDPLV